MEHFNRLTRIIPDSAVDYDGERKNTHYNRNVAELSARVANWLASVTLNSRKRVQYSSVPTVAPRHQPQTCSLTRTATTDLAVTCSATSAPVAELFARATTASTRRHRLASETLISRKLVRSCSNTFRSARGTTHPQSQQLILIQVG